MIITYKHYKIYQETKIDNFIDFKNYLLENYLSKKSFLSITKEIESKILDFFNTNEIVGTKKIKLFISSLIGIRNQTNIKFWTERGWSIDQAKQKISEIQSKNGMKFSEKQKLNPEFYSSRTPSQLGYWIKKGYTEIEAKQKVSEKQSVFSKEKLIYKYGEEYGIQILQERNNRWINSLHTNNNMNLLNKSKGLNKEKFIEKHGIEKYIENRQNLFNSSKNLKISKANKQSTVLFNKILERIPELHNFTILIGNKNNKEFSLYDKENKKLYFYDFTILELKVIIEFNGSHVHPNPSLSTEEWNNWKNVFSHTSADESYLFDQTKNNFALQIGYKLLTIWNTDTLEFNLNKCVSFISNVLNEFQEFSDTVLLKS